MFDNITEALNYIELKRHKRTLEEFKTTLESVGINVNQGNMIHVAGTNGKGSTVNYLRAILNAHGYKVGTFTSPYLVKHNDRICVDGTPISDDDLLHLINKYHDVIERDDMSMFEIDTMLMLDYFDNDDIDFRIIECGIGGRHDKTNVIEASVSVITNVAKDHLEQIGPTIFDVINEKMGIIKPGQMFVTSEVSGTILARFQEECDAYDARMIVVPEYVTDHYPVEFQYRDMDFVFEDQAAYQISNARLALTVAAHLITLNQNRTIKAVEECHVGGRFEKFTFNNKQVVIDGAHNVPGIEALIHTLKCQANQDICVVFSALGDKDVEEMIELLADTDYEIYITSFSDERYKDLKNLVADRDNLHYMATYDEAIKTSTLRYTQTVVTGSLHFISNVRKYLLEESH